MPPKKPKKLEIPFDEKLLLFKFCLAKIGKRSFSELSKVLRDDEYLGYDANNTSLFCHVLKAWCGGHGIHDTIALSHEKLAIYDENIFRHLRHISAKRGTMTLKYFQYIALLFTEMYLDSYFSDKTALLHELNAFVAAHCAKHPGLEISPYTQAGLHKLCFMCATGSGKTLLMHINILQYKYYFEIAKRNTPQLALDNILLITPNEGLSRQHHEELQLSDIPTTIFTKHSWGKGLVCIIDIHKLDEHAKAGSKGKSVAVDAFEGNNLVLVDEGHKGLSGNVWYDYRTRLAANGFSFEYSATFKQALKGTSKEAKALTDEYGKAIIMDYSYKYFYNDGYGKDYRIYNLNKGITDEQENLYLTGCLLSFYQQCKVYADNAAAFAPFYIEKPLLVFVGNRVTKKTSAAEFTDVERVLHTINDFTSKPHMSLARMNAIFSEQTGLVNTYGRELFAHSLAYIATRFGDDMEAMYHDILQTIFCSTQPGRLSVVDFKHVSGEIGLKIGESSQYFGLISIGDTAKMRKMCEAKGLVTETSEFENTSFFANINTAHSPVTMLIGSRKFTEGWNSWRVSTMGLINFAKGEGSQAIQLFGRGVRLRGFAGCLKRSRALQGRDAIPQHIHFLEKLTIFGVKADYMTAFKEHLENEDVGSNENIYEITLPTIRRFDAVKHKKLRVLRLHEGMSFKKQGERHMLGVPTADFADYLDHNTIMVDAYAKVQGIVSVMDSAEKESHKEEQKLPHLPLLDWQRIYTELQRYKNEKNFYNMCIYPHMLHDILSFEKGAWYTLFMPSAEKEISSMKTLHHLTDIAIILLKKYIEKYFFYYKNQWESPYLQYAHLTADDKNFVDEYILEVDFGKEKNEELEGLIKELSEMLTEKGCIESYSYAKSEAFALTLFDFRNHLYAPLVRLHNKTLKIEVSPVSLTQSEQRFVDALKIYCENNTDFFADKELYLLRNKSKVGMGFFEVGNFYPDFVLWLIDDRKQYVTFIDPKGLLRVDNILEHPKVLFAQSIKALEGRLAHGDNKDIVLNSFIFSDTPPRHVLKHFGIASVEELENRHVLFLEEENCIKKMFEKIIL